MAPRTFKVSLAYPDGAAMLVFTVTAGLGRFFELRS